ncbi:MULTISPECIES: alpha-amylase family glycosyl hydrolase [Geobacter]|uniref:Alpha-amylase n=1 Tax=Geobacter anodireducens TaxID=1340425 RepID=A0ABR9NV29_9BACT|nr:MULTISPECIES: alpha-amylase family glycosyl hydrolase [Geobacter]MBE2888110.1 alpha-amylase [Geobacter anodireducens]
MTAPQSIRDLDLERLCNRIFHPSPSAWEDEVLYFLLLDRFSDGNETGYRDNRGRRTSRGDTPPYRPADAGNAIATEPEAAAWREAGTRWCGGNLKGLMGKMGYLRRLGVTAVWVSPLFKQCSFVPTYHGYGIQNFLDVDPHFGTRDDLRELVRVAHANGIYVILDIILNHAGNVFAYDRGYTPYDGGTSYPVTGFRTADGTPSLPFGPSPAGAWPDGAVWPRELQAPECFTRKGYIRDWDRYHEYLDGDFFDLKDIHLGDGDVDTFSPSPALLALCEAYKYWIAYADLDGYRIDTVKHMGPGATRFFASAIHEFAQRIGKENFYLIGEITGGRVNAFDTLETTGLNAALGVDDIPLRLEDLVKGKANPADYFDLFRNSLLVRKESHAWFRDKVVTVIDDHDQVCRGAKKERFCAGDPSWRRLVLNALALNATTLGIPCIYYGTEQAFDGEGGDDRYLRECMFGGPFGAFRSRGVHFFDEDNPVYRECAKVLALRRDIIALRRGRQYLREISGDGVNFGLPYAIGGEIRSVVAWSRIFDTEEIVLAINTDPDHPRTALVLVDGSLHRAGDAFVCRYSTDPDQVRRRVVVRDAGPAIRAVELRVPAAGFVMFQKRYYTRDAGPAFA